jgi:predicted permease
MDTLLQDLRFSMRALSRERSLTFVAALTIALGVAATTVVFSLVNALLLRPLPVTAPHELVTLQEVVEGRPGAPAYSHARYVDYADATAPAFTGLVAHGYAELALRGDGQAQALSGVAATGNYFDVLQIRPAVGRFFTDTDDRRDASEPVVVLSHHIWQERFNGDAAVVGRTIHLNSRPVTVIGVAPDDFGGTYRGVAADMFIPIATYAQLDPGSDAYARGRHIWLTMFGRLRSDVAREQATVIANAAAVRVEPENAVSRRATGAQLEPLSGLPSGARTSVTAFMMMLMATALLVLLIAATNVAGMLLARGAGRAREIATRVALGASRGRVVRQLLTESTLLFVIGGAAGVLMATWLAALLARFQPPVSVRIALDVGVDARVLGFALLLSLVTGLLFGLAPALVGTRLDLAPWLKQGPGAIGPRRTRLRSSLVVGQLSVALLLLVIAGLFGRALQGALAQDFGFDPDNIVVVAADVEPHGYDEARGVAFHEALVERVRALPGVSSVGLAVVAPLSGNEISAGYRPPDGPEPEDGRWPSVRYNIVDPGYFATMGIALVAGRDFTPDDRAGAPRVVIINEEFARRLWPGADPIGRQLHVADGPAEVVGVARNSTYATFREPAVPLAYAPFAQDYAPRMMLFARTDHTAAALTGIRQALQTLDPNVPPESLMPLTGVIGLSLYPQRIAALLIGAFGFVGLLLAALGIYGVLAYHVAQRTREIGIRVALGARSHDVLQLVLRQGSRLVFMGAGLGLVLAFATTRLITAFLHGLSATDPVTFIAVPLLLVAVALFAAYAPARRAAALDPMTALRQDG